MVRDRQKKEANTEQDFEDVPTRTSAPVPHICSTSDCRLGIDGSRTELTDDTRDERPVVDALEFVRARAMAAAAALLPRLRV